MANRRALPLGISCAALLASGAVWFAPSAWAQGAPETEEEIIVTAQRREEALQDVPLSVSAISAENLAVRGVDSLSDLRVGAVPGVDFGQFAGTPTVLGITIRGVFASDPSQGTQELPAPVYVDGVFLGRAQGLGLDLIEPERLEILRGPQGQLFGRNAEGGAVQFVSRRPSGEFGLDASASFGNHDSRRYRVRMDLPEFADISLQLSALHNEHDAYTDNAPEGVYARQSDFAFLDADGFRIAARWAPTDTFTLDYTYDDSTTDDSQPYLTYIDLSGAVPQAGSQPASSDYPETSSRAYLNDSYRTEASGHALTATWQLSDAVTLRSITAFREASRHGTGTLSDAISVDLTGGLAPYCTVAACAIAPNAGEDIEQSQTSQEFQLLGSWERFDLTIGAIYYNEEVDDQRTGFLTGPGLALFALPDPLPTTLNIQDSETESYGIYAQGTYTPPILNDRLDVTLGLRYSDDSKTARRTVAGFVPLAVPIVSEFAAERWDPAVTLQYNWTDDLNTYVRYATAYRAGGANVRSSVFSSYEEEEIATWEIGLKSQFWDDRATLNLALYRNEINGAQLTLQEAPTVNPGLTNTINAPVTYEVQGLEVEFSVRATDDLTLGVNAAFMDSDLPTFDNPLTAPVDVQRFFPTATPDSSGSILVDWLTHFTPVGEVLWHADYSYSSGYWTTSGPLPLTFPFARPQSEVSQLNARIAWRDIPLGQGFFEVALWGRNLLDSADIVYSFDGCANGVGGCAFRSEPLTAGVELRVRY
ncbi:MAG: TonB-dependent receptor [Hydrogenophilaceae bacterium]|jgi:iron complex outermembrane receptor protein|nr:TonB-dependent receptor [Hydrogenophilaceae bacterium]